MQSWDLAELYAGSQTACRACWTRFSVAIHMLYDRDVPTFSSCFRSWLKSKLLNTYQKTPYQHGSSLSTGSRARQALRRTRLWAMGKRPFKAHGSWDLCLWQAKASVETRHRHKTYLDCRVCLNDEDEEELIFTVMCTERMVCMSQIIPWTLGTARLSWWAFSTLENNYNV